MRWAVRRDGRFLHEGDKGQESAGRERKAVKWRNVERGVYVMRSCHGKLLDINCNDNMFVPGLWRFVF